MENEDEQIRRVAKDPKRKAKSNDPGWKFVDFPYLDTNRDMVNCALWKY